MAQINKFIPSRWTKKMEKSYYAISFNQGPQICPGKNLVIFLAQSFIYNLFRIKKIKSCKDLVAKKINIKNIDQMINTCELEFKFNNFNSE